MGYRRLALALGGVILLAAGRPAFARPDCSYKPISDMPKGRGVVLERGLVRCKVQSATLASAVTVLRVAMTTPGRFLAATPPPRVPPQPDDNPKHYAGSVFALELPTGYLKSMTPKHGPIQPYGRVGQAAVNANLFTNAPWYSRKTMPTAATWLRGLLIANGQVFNPVGGNAQLDCTPSPSTDCFPAPFDATLAFDNAGRASIRTIDPPGAGRPKGSATAGIVTAVTGSHMLLSSGGNVAPGCPDDACVGEFYGPNSRTAAGLTQGNTGLLLVTVDSTGTSKGVQLDQLAELMSQLGAQDAINLDGGGSTAMAVAAGGTVSIANRLRDPSSPCDFPATGGCERYVGTALLVGVDYPAGRRMPSRGSKR